VRPRPRLASGSGGRQVPDPLDLRKLAPLLGQLIADLGVAVVVLVRRKRSNVE
jgi:hypothetical protein